MQQRKNIAYYINLLIFIVLASYIFLEGYGVYEQGRLEITKLIIAVLVCGVITVIVWITEAKGFIRAIKSNYAVRVTTEVVSVLMVITMAMLIRIYSMSNYDIILYQEAVVIVCMLLAYGTARLFSEVAVITLIANIFWPVMMNRYNFTLQSLLVVAEIYMMIFVMAVLIYLFRENKNKQRIFSGISIALIFAAVLLCLPRIADIQVKQISDFVANLENCFAFEDSMRYYCLICVGMAVVAVCRMWIGTGNYSSIIVLLLNVIILASTLYASGIKYAYLAIPLLSIVISAVSGDNRCEALQQQGEAADSTSPVKDDGKKETLPQMQQEEAEEELLEDGLLEEELSETAREPDKVEEIEEFEEEFEEALSQEQKAESSPRVVEEEELPELPRKRKVESLSAVDDDEIEEMLNSVIVVEKAPPRMTIEEFEQLANDEDDDGVDVSQLILKNNKDKGDEKVKLFGKKNGNNEEPKKQENNNSNQNEAYSVPEVMSLEENAFIMSDMYTPQEDFELELPGMEKAKEQEENSYGSTEFEMPDSLEELEGVSEDSPFGFMFEGLTGQSVTSEAGSSYEAEEESESGANPYAAMFEFDEDAAYGDSEEGKEEVDLDLDDIPEFEVPELTVPEMKIPDLKVESVEEVPVVQSETEENPYAIMFESYAEEEEPSVQLEDVLADVEPEVQAEEPIQVEAEQMEVQQEQSDKEEEAAQEAAFDIEIPTEPEMEFDVEPHSLYIKPDDDAEEKEAPAEDNDIPLVTEADENPYVLNMPFDPIIEESPYAQEMVFVDSSSKENQQSEETAEDGTSPVITGESNTIVFEDMIELVEKSEDTDEKKEILQAIKTLETSMKHEESDTEEEKKNKKKITDSVMDSVLKFLKKNDKEEKKQVIYAGERFGDTVTNTYGSARPAFSTPIPGWEPPVISDVETTDAVDMSVFGGTKEAGTVEKPSDMEVPADEALEQAAQDIAGEEENAFVFGSDTEEENAVVMAEFIRAVDDSNESVIDFTAEETTVDTVTVGETSTENAAEVDETESNAEEQQVEMTDADNSTEETVWESVQEEPVSEMDEQLAEEYKFEVPELPKPTVAPAQMSGPAEDVEDEPFFDWSTFDPSLLEKMKQEEEGNAAIMAEQLAKEEAEKAAREEEERKAREEAERLAREEAERKAREEAERLAREEAERKAREEAERLAREEAERKAREEAERLAREEAERKAREEAERLAREEAERKAREEAERLAREEAERKEREEAERLAREEAERKEKEEAERLAREEEERKAREENTDMEELQKENEALKSELSEMKDQINNIEKLLLEMAKNQK